MGMIEDTGASIRSKCSKCSWSLEELKRRKSSSPFLFPCLFLPLSLSLLHIHTGTHKAHIHTLSWMYIGFILFFLEIGYLRLILRYSSSFSSSFLNGYWNLCVPIFRFQEDRILWSWIWHPYWALSPWIYSGKRVWILAQMTNMSLCKSALLSGDPGMERGSRIRDKGLSQMGQGEWAGGGGQEGNSPSPSLLWTLELHFLESPSKTVPDTERNSFVFCVLPSHPYPFLFLSVHFLLLFPSFAL